MQKVEQKDSDMIVKEHILQIDRKPLKSKTSHIYKTHI